MMYKSSIAMAAAMLSASVVNAHVEMIKPVPYGSSSLDNSPLLANGDDFPCKLRDGVYDPPETPNPPMAIGETQTLQLMGSAVHGGGSCQISLTKDMQPTAESEWMVIHSIEAGCPASIPGNFAENAERRNPDFKYTIPEGISPGKYTLAWTWFNKVGNREMYMNCAPITVKSNSAKRNEEMQSKRESNFPSMFVANIGNGCTTKEGVDVRFPEPGDSVDENNGNLKEPPQNCRTGSSSGGSNSGNSGNSGSSPDTPKPAPEPQPQPQPEPEPETPSAPEPETPEEPAPEEPSTPAPETPETPSAPSGSGDALSGSCSTEGEWNCIGGSSYQRCASGTWSAAQPLSAGTSCQTGQGAELSMVDSRRVRNRDIHSRRRSIGSQHA